MKYTKKGRPTLIHSRRAETSALQTSPWYCGLHLSAALLSHCVALSLCSGFTQTYSCSTICAVDVLPQAVASAEPYSSPLARVLHFREHTIKALPSLVFVSFLLFFYFFFFNKGHGAGALLSDAQPSLPLFPRYPRSCLSSFLSRSVYVSVSLLL